jgi:hypothetical protein
MQPLDDALTALPHLGRALVHTMLEGFAADDFTCSAWSSPMMRSAISTASSGAMRCSTWRSA